MATAERSAGAVALGFSGVSRDEIPGFLQHVGRELGPPWTADHKAAALAAVLALS